MIRNSNADPYNNKDQPHSNPEPHTATELLRCCHAQPFANPQTLMRGCVLFASAVDRQGVR